MNDYYVNNSAQPNRDHEVHKNGCDYMPADRTYLGRFSGCHAAVRQATTLYPQSNGCYWCSPACHTS